jgi:hypothetical protein
LGGIIEVQHSEYEPQPLQISNWQAALVFDGETYKLIVAIELIIFVRFKILALTGVNR